MKMIISEEELVSHQTHIHKYNYKIDSRKKKSTILNDQNTKLHISAIRWGQ